MYEKDVYKDVGGQVNVSRKKCIRSELPLTSRYVERYWFDAIRTVGAYEKQRGLVGRHLLLSDNRIEAGLKLYKNHHIEQATITKEQGGDALIYVTSKSGDKQHIVVVKNFLPTDEKNPQYAYQREIYISNLQTSCDCEDYMISGRYKNNATLLCHHQIAAFFYLQDKWNAPKIFITPEEKTFGYKKSDVEEIETNVDALPLIKFSQFINILLLKNFREMKPACGLSIHRVANDTHEEIGRPIWMTYTDEKDVLRLAVGLIRVYNKMVDEEKQLIIAGLSKEPYKKKPWWQFWKHINR